MNCLLQLYGLWQGRVRVDGFADVGGVTAHFDGQADFADHVAGVGADDAAANNQTAFSIKNQLGEAFVAAGDNRDSVAQQLGYSPISCGG